MGFGPWAGSGEPPLEIDEDRARDLLQGELAKSEYTQASPTWLDLWIDDFWNWVNDILQPIDGVPGGLSPIALVLGAIVVLAVIALLVGRPILVQRARRRSAFSPDLFDGDERSAQELRASAAAAGARGDFETAVIEQFRALARAVHDRTVIALSPGMTATAVAEATTSAFPGQAPGLHRAARSFNAARYLGLGASEDDWLALREVDSALQAAKPVALTSFSGRAS
ncbi:MULTISPECIES: DUF4129 domain-containing protein [unclassified Pseudoclavibacter]|uniref:DUF4129 domain-containing protein n=1 Tax=unclassified Pseudoclavibacter TaxID=2615177 RepID=UPI001BAE4C48|nr:DUF4129 domain-containing protein [Pseudoclavibacter sp. Marseille-Q4354]MBS3178489.1 DUF4129 domain-containing protein [Pseudoclavibacter sp. Marseille-Q4354]